jgi:hypothetical protein
LAGPPFSVYFARPFLDLIGEFIEPTRRFRVSYLGRQTTALDDLALNLNQQFNVFDHNQVLKQATAIFNWATQGRTGRSNAGCADANDNVADHAKDHDSDGDPNPTWCWHDDH